MPLKVVLQNLNGERRFDEAVPLNAALDRVLPVFEDASFPLLRFIDPYGDTLFNGNQMHGFLTEWDRIILTLGNGDDRKFFLRVREMAEKCKEKPHVFLRFIGD